MERAFQFGIQCIQRSVSGNDAVMFDIDDTLIRVTDQAPIPEMVTLFHMCKSKGFKMVIITARPYFENNVIYTYEQLMALGIVPDLVLFSSAPHKTFTKKQTNLRFVLSVGDQYTDLGFSDHWIKLPDTINKNIYFK
jgi:hypothetical protein